MENEKLIFSENGDDISLKEENGKYFLIRRFKDLNTDDVDQLLKAAARIQKLNHKNLSVLESVVKEGDDYILMESLPSAISLRDMLNRNEKLPLATVKWIAVEIMQGLAYAHPVLLHGNIRPEYIWVDQNSRTAVLSGFGIFTSEGEEYLSSPEQLQGNDLSERSDIFSLGATIYHALTGKKLPNPIHVKRGLAGFSPPKDVVGVDHVWNNFIMRCLNFSPSKRFQTIKDVLSFLKITTNDTPQQQQRMVSPESITRKSLLSKNKND